MARWDLPVPYPAIAMVNGSSGFCPLIRSRISRVNVAVSTRLWPVARKSSSSTP